MPVASAFAVVLLATLAQTTAETYAWPLDLPRELTSSFAEYRPGRFHMGIDLRTGPIGKDVRAAADGYVSRLRCSPYGYGKAVYVQFDDGNSAVYAHLDDFAPALRDYVRAAQHAREEYTVDLTVPRDQFRVTRGEIIAKSGQTGIGVPHLHYELRDRAGVPINPRLLGVTWPDNTPPDIRAVALTPMAPDSLVNGDPRPAVIPVKRVAQGLYEAPEVRVRGPLTFALDTIDPAAGGSRLGVYRVRVTDSETEIFRLEHDRVSYDHDDDGAIAYHPGLMEQGKMLTLSRWPGNDSEIYAVSKLDGLFSLAARERALIEILVEDFHGNASLLTVPLRNDAADLPAPPPSPQPAGTVTYESSGVALIATVAFKGDEAETPVLVSSDGMQMPCRRVGRRTFRAAYFPTAGAADLELHVQHPGIAANPERFVFVKRGTAPGKIFFGDAIVHVAPDSPYGMLVLRVSPRDTDTTPGLTVHGPAYEVFPSYLPVDTPITISLPIPGSIADPKRAHLYRREKDKWSRVDTERVAGRAEAAVRRLGVYAVLEDATPPVLELFQPTPAGSNQPARPTIRLRATDEGSGIDTFRATYNGNWILLGYDPEQDLLDWEQDEDLPAGDGVLVVEVRDHAGNVTRVERAIVIAGA